MRRPTTPRGRTWGVLLLLLGTGCGSAQQQQPDEAAARAERRARRASQRVRGPVGTSPTAPAPGKAAGNGTAAAGAAVDPATQRHPILLDPPATVGERAFERSEVQFQQQQIVRVDGQTVADKTSDVGARIEGISRVVEVNADGVPIVTEFVVDSAAVEVEGQSENVAARGDIITIRRKGPEPRIEGPNGAYSGKAALAMELIFTTSDPGVSNDRVFGTSQQRGVGDSWAIDGAAAAQDLSAGGKLRVDGSQVSGQTTLVAAKRCANGQTCLTVRSEMDIASFELANLPPGASIRDSSGLVRVEQTHPVKVRSAPAYGHLDMRIQTIVGFQRDDKDVELETRIRTIQKGYSEPR